MEGIMGDTRKRILDVALDLFAQRGYTSVSIRDICKEVSIKESSVYYHFTNKRAIFDELLDKFQVKAQGMMHQLDSSLSENPGALTGNIGGNVSDFFFEQYLMDDFCNTFLRVLSIEQFNSTEARKTFDTWFIAEPLRYQGTVFRALIERGLIKQQDHEYLAIKFYAPILLFTQRWLLSGNLCDESKNQFRKDAQAHIQHFFTENLGASEWQT
jgi:AcrR family transcriptional regulator